MKPSDRQQHAQGGHGRGVTAPLQLPAGGWKKLLLQTKQQVKEDQLPMVAGAMAFFSTLALFPGIIALISIYGLVSDPDDVERQISSLSTNLPRSVSELLSQFLHSTAAQADATLGWGAALGILGAIWSASSGTVALIKAVNIAYSETETPSVLKLRAKALLLTLGLIIAVGVAIGLIAVVPAILSQLGLREPLQVLFSIARWPLLALAMIGALGAIYRYAPNRPRPRWRWVSWGAVLATLGWLGASLLFSLYVSQFGSFGNTYGPVAGVIVLMLWLFVSSFLVLLGAEVNAELEAQAPSASSS